MNQNSHAAPLNQYCVSEGHPDFVGGQSYRDAINGTAQGTSQVPAHLEVEIDNTD
jgi:hypothetical protein